MAVSKGVIRECGKTEVPKWMEVVGNGYFGEDPCEEIMLGHVEKLAEPGKDVEGVLDVVRVGELGSMKFDWRRAL